MNTKKNLRLMARAVAVTAVTLSLIISASSYTVANANSLAGLKSEYAQLQQQEQKLQDQLNDLNRKVTAESSKKAVLDKNIRVIKQQVKVMNVQVKATKAKLKQKNHDIAVTQKNIKSNIEQYKERVCTIYETGNTSKVEVLLSSKSVSDFLMRYETLQVISDHDNAIISNMKKDEATLKADKAVLQNDLTSLQSSEATLAAKQQVLNVQIKQQAEVVARLKHNANAKSQATDAISEKARETDAQINAEIAKEAAARKRQLEEEQSSTPSDQSGSGSSSVGGNAIVSYARGFIGTPYVLGSAGPGTFDCSGLTAYVYANAAGIYLPHSAAEQSGYGTYVARGDLQPGDLVFFATDGGTRITHVGIYSGNGDFVEANAGYSTGYKVIETGLFSSSYWAPRYITARRILH